MPLVVPSKDEIMAAFARNTEFPVGSQKYEVFKDYLPRLPELFGPDRLEERLDLKILFEVEIAFLKMVLAEETRKNIEDRRELRLELEDAIPKLTQASADVAFTLAIMETTEGAIFLAEEAGLSAEQREAYEYGELTFADVVRDSPHMFVF
jgi:hypothetical protein